MDVNVILVKARDIVRKSSTQAHGRRGFRVRDVNYSVLQWAAARAAGRTVFQPDFEFPMLLKMSTTSVRPVKEVVKLSCLIP